MEETPVKQVWEMNEAERLVERNARYQTFAEAFRRKGAGVEMVGSQLVVATPKNNYLIEMLPADPRFVSVGLAYEVIPGDIDRASWACYNAQALSLVAKAKAEPEGNGYMLYFAVEAIHDTAQAFLNVADIQFACLEDCREKYLNLMRQAIDEEDLSWSTQPR
jgi:hypothetical protein